MDVLHNLAFGFEHADLATCCSAPSAVRGNRPPVCCPARPLATISIPLPPTDPDDGRAAHAAGPPRRPARDRGSRTVKIPHASSIVACIDGYQMTPRQDLPGFAHRGGLELHRRHRGDRRAFFFA
jgi:hypothetical protein